MQYEQNARYEITVTAAEYATDGTLRLSVELDRPDAPNVEELLTTGYVKLSVYDPDEFGENGTLTLFGSGNC